MRAVWKGYLKVSLITIPIKMYTAITRRRSIQFHQLHRKCNSRIKQESSCSSCNEKITKEEIVRGYPYGKDSYVVITDEEIQQAQKASTDSIDILKFVDDSKIHPIYYSDSHYLVPDGKVGVEAYALFHKAMATTKKAALAKVVMRNREHLFTIKPYNGALIAHSLHYAEEIQSVDKIEEAGQVERIKPSKDNLSMAKTIIQNLSGDFVPEEFQDEYTNTLMEIIKAKAEGAEVKLEAKEEKERVVSLMDALRQSVEETEKPPKKAMAVAGTRTKKVERKRKKA